MIVLSNVILSNDIPPKKLIRFKANLILLLSFWFYFASSYKKIKFDSFLPRPQVEVLISSPFSGVHLF